MHPLYAGKITISGQDGADAKRYQEKEVQQAIEEIEGKEQDDSNEVPNDDSVV